MTVSTFNNVVVYRGNGSATAFAVPFKVLDEDHLVVTRRVFATGVDDHTYVGTDYSYSGIGDSSGTLTLAGTALSSVHELVIERIVPYSQDLDIVNAGGFYPDSVEEQLDLTVMGVQQLAGISDRALKLPVGETAGPLSFTLDQLNEMVAAGYVLGNVNVASLIGYLPVAGGEATNLQAALRRALPLTPEMFDSSAGTGGDDTVALQAVVAAANAAGSSHIRLTPGKTYLLGHVGQSTLYFHDVDGLFIEGWGATLKTIDEGCPTLINGPQWGKNWGQINIDNCTNVHILGLTFDGNRSGQTHTAGGAYSFGVNFGLNFWTADFPHSTSDVWITGCTFKDHGNLTSQADIAGDAIFMISGVSRIWIEGNLFVNVGRWATALAEGADSSSHVYFRYNTVINPDRGDAPLTNHPWGTFDLEDSGLDHDNIYIDDNVLIGTTQVSVGGYNSTPVNCTVSDLSICRNVYLIPGGDTGANTPFSLGVSNPPGGSYRTLKRMLIEDNKIVWTGLPRSVHIGQTAKLVDCSVLRNRFEADGTSVDGGGIFLADGGHMEGRIEIIDNRFIGLGEAIKNSNNWYASPSPAELELRIENNRYENCYRSYALDFRDLVAPTGTSKIIFRGNISRDTRDVAGPGEYLDGGGIVTEYYDAVDADKIYAHLQLTYKGNSRTLGPLTVATLPTASAPLIGARAIVTDANTTTFMSTVAGSGSNTVPVICDGTNWKIG